VQVLIHSFPVLSACVAEELICGQGNCKTSGIEFDIRVLLDVKCQLIQCQVVIVSISNLGCFTFEKCVNAVIVVYSYLVTCKFSCKVWFGD